MDLFARFDRLRANTLSGDSQSWYYNGIGDAYITGVHYNPAKGISVSLNYQGWKPFDSGQKLQHHILLSVEYKL